MENQSTLVPVWCVSPGSGRGLKYPLTINAALTDADGSQYIMLYQNSEVPGSVSLSEGVK